MAADPDDTWRGAIGILTLIGFPSLLGGIAYLLYGPGITITIPNFINVPTTTPATAADGAALSGQQAANEVEQFFASQPGQFFRCEAGKSLKAEFTGTNVRLALSDGRVVTLPQTVGPTGEIRYANANNSFVFLNTGNKVSVVESNIATYANCVVLEN